MFKNQGVINYSSYTELLPLTVQSGKCEYLSVFLCSPACQEKGWSLVEPSCIELCLFLYACVQLEDFTDGHCSVG